MTLQLMAYKASSLSRAEHADICERKDIELNRRLDKLEDTVEKQFLAVTKTLEKQDAVSTESRHAQNSKLQEIILNVALLNNRRDPTNQDRG